VFKLSRVASGNVAFTLEPVNAGHLRLKRSYPRLLLLLSWNDKLEKGFHALVALVEELLHAGANDPVRRSNESRLSRLATLHTLKARPSSGVAWK
jgi:hypothetical protein